MKRFGLPGKGGPFYGWWLVALIGFVMGAAVLPLYSTHAWGAAPLGQEFGWPNSQLPWLLSLWRIIELLAPVQGYLADWLGARRMVIPGLCIMGGALLLVGFAPNPLLFYAALALLAAGLFLTSPIPLTVTLCLWFVRRRAAAIAVATVTAAILALALGPFLIPLAETSGVGSTEAVWFGGRAYVILSASLILALAVPVFALLRNRPEDVALLPDGGPAAIEQGSFSATQALRSRAFWFIVLGAGFSSAGIPAVSSHLYLLPDHRGILPAEASESVYIHTYVSLGFILVGGLAGDRVPKADALAFFAAIQAMGMALLAVADNLPALYLAGLLLGIGEGGRVPLNLAILADYFHTESLGKILGLFLLFSALFNSFTGPLLAGLMYEARDSYVTYFLILAGLGLLGAYFYRKAQAPDTVAPQAAPSC